MGGVLGEEETVLAAARALRTDRVNSAAGGERAVYGDAAGSRVCCTSWLGRIQLAVIF